MYNIVKKPAVRPKSPPTKNQSHEKEEIEPSEEETAKFEGLPVCPVSGDSSKGCNRIACLHREKVKHPYYLIDTRRPPPAATQELPERPRPDMVFDKVSKPEKPFPKCPPPLYPLPPRRDPIEEQQRRATLTEYTQRLRKCNEE